MAVGQLEPVALNPRRGEVKGQVFNNEIATVLYMIIESDAARPLVMVFDLHDCDFPLLIAVEELFLLAKPSTGTLWNQSLLVVANLL